MSVLSEACHWGQHKIRCVCKITHRHQLRRSIRRPNTVSWSSTISCSINIALITFSTWSSWKLLHVARYGLHTWVVIFFFGHAQTLTCQGLLLMHATEQWGSWYTNKVGVVNWLKFGWMGKVHKAFGMVGADGLTTPMIDLSSLLVSPCANSLSCVSFSTYLHAPFSQCFTAVPLHWGQNSINQT